MIFMIVAEPYWKPVKINYSSNYGGCKGDFLKHSEQTYRVNSNCRITYERSIHKVLIDQLNEPQGNIINNIGSHPSLDTKRKLDEAILILNGLDKVLDSSISTSLEDFKKRLEIVQKAFNSKVMILINPSMKSLRKLPIHCSVS
ncbi:hypothetical protein ACTA71_006619 [Dictyostelium dimigraforme]